MPNITENRSRLKIGLSAKLLVLTVAFVMLSEILIFAPSISRFRKVYLEDHISKAQLATLAIESMPKSLVSDALKEQLLSHSDSYGIILKSPERKILAISKNMPGDIDLTIDLKESRFPVWISDAFAVLVQDKNRILRVIGTSPKNPKITVEVILDEAPMRQAMYAYAGRILNLSLVISFLTAGLVYLSLHLLLVRPMGRITESMTAFRADPEKSVPSIPSSSRTDEIGTAQRELAVMQDKVRAALLQKTRLATLGAAVAKINHDLRNSLSTAVLVSDRLAKIEDPEVKAVTPRLYDAIGRAVVLCSQTLSYVANPKPVLDPTLFHLHELVAEAGAEVQPLLPEILGFSWKNAVPFDLDVVADRGQLFRVFSNLGLNALHAGSTQVEVKAEHSDGKILIDFCDNGPGISEAAQEQMFEPFTGSSGRTGTGLGLTIARDIMLAHGGSIALAHSGDDGTIFRLELPGSGGDGEK